MLTTSTNDSNKITSRAQNNQHLSQQIHQNSVENQATQITHTTNFDFNQNSAANVFATLSVPQMSMNLSPAPYTNALNPLSGVGSGKMPLIPKAGSGLIRA